MKQVDGGVCASKGYKASGIHCGIRKNKDKKDLALVVSECRAAAAAVYTLNLVQGAPITVTKANISDGYARAMLCNSGYANTCNANGQEVAQEMCKMVEDATGIAAEDVIIASTGVIGIPLPLEPILLGMPKLTSELTPSGGSNAAEAIMTTDTHIKELAVSFEIDGKTCCLGGMAKGSGMIHPNMATMLVFLTTDVAISTAMLQKALSNDVKYTFNMVSVDGDTSTNDMVSIMANGCAGNACITEEGADFEVFCAALRHVTTALCKMIAKDGEGATKLITCNVLRAADEKTAQIVAKSVVCSSLLKSAIFGEDANWGRVLCAIGYSGANLDVEKIDVSFSSAKGELLVCKSGVGVPFSEEKAKILLSSDEVVIIVDLNSGDGSATAWGCDLTYDYVKINGDYRT